MTRTTLICLLSTFFFFFFFNDTATTEIYTLSLHDALPILHEVEENFRVRQPVFENFKRPGVADDFGKLSEPDELPPRKRAEPEHRTIERGQQQDMEITVGDVGTLVGKHRPALRPIPIDVLRGKQDGRSEGDRPADDMAHAHV